MQWNIVPNFADLPSPLLRAPRSIHWIQRCYFFENSDLRFSNAMDLLRCGLVLTWLHVRQLMVFSSVTLFFKRAGSSNSFLSFLQSRNVCQPTVASISTLV